MSSEAPRPRHVSLPVWILRHRTEVLLGAVAFLLLAIATLGFIGSAVSSRFDNRRWNLPSRIYSDITVLEPGSPGSPDRLAAKLERLFYARVSGSPETPGHYRRAGESMDVYSRDFVYPGREFRGFRARVDFAGGRVRAITDERGDPVPALVVEPERLGSVFGEEHEDRTLVRLSEVPRTLVDAVLVTEDRDFYRHSGVSVKRTFGAVLATLRGGNVQGGSTLTQQLVKNVYLTPERTLRRKAIEIVIAVLLDARYSKDEILEAYLNEIYLGRRGSIAIKGVGEAARFYFGKQVSDLDLAESATIAGMIPAPERLLALSEPEAHARPAQPGSLVDAGAREDRPEEHGGGDRLAARAPHAPSRQGDRAALRRLRQGRAHRGATAKRCGRRGCRSTRRSTWTSSRRASARSRRASEVSSGATGVLPRPLARPRCRGRSSRSSRRPAP